MKLNFRSFQGPVKMREKFSKLLDGQHPTSGQDQQVCEDETRCDCRILYICRNIYMVDGCNIRCSTLKV